MRRLAPLRDDFEMLIDCLVTELLVATLQCRVKKGLGVTNEFCISIVSRYNTEGIVEKRKK